MILSGFDSREPVLDEWLRRRATQNEASGASRTYVVCVGRQVVGYYSLAVGAVAHTQAVGRVRRNMPDPVPVMVLGRLAVDKYHGQGIGSGLLRDAILRTTQAADIAGIKAILVHAISESAKRFYEKHGFAALPYRSDDGDDHDCAGDQNRAWHLIYLESSITASAGLPE
jgi:predicted N-acetyltransferase YhbS